MMYVEKRKNLPAFSHPLDKGDSTFSLPPQSRGIEGEFETNEPPY
jgi:hypothetical protein